MRRSEENSTNDREAKAFIYARVSSKEQETSGYSIPAQLTLLRDYALVKGLQVVHEFVDVETAKAAGRKQFDEMVRFCRSHKQVVHILVEKTDRLYRNIKDWVTLDELAVEVHLVKENEILRKDSRSHSKLTHGFKVLIAKHFLDNLSEEVKKGQLEKAQQGEYPAKAPLGYRNNTSTNLVEVDEGMAKFVVRMFELASSARYSLPQIRKQVRQEGLEYYSPKVRLSKSHVKRILENPFYIGSFKWNGIVYKGKHAPLVSTDLFERVQTVLGDRRKPKYRKRSFAYGGLLLCGGCGCMVTAEIKKGRYIYYHCTQSRNHCDEIYYREEDLSPQFDALVRSITIPPSIRDWLIKALKESHQDEAAFHREALTRLQTELKKVKNRLDQLYIDKLDGKVLEDFWLEKSREWGADQARLVSQIQSHKVADHRYYDDGFKILELASKAHELYSKQLPEQKNKFLRILLSNCTLQGGNLRPTYRKPFDVLATGIESGKWGG
jgi:DNA invertase Pin-like site-specific DNA recombinase